MEVSFLFITIHFLNNSANIDPIEPEKFQRGFTKLYKKLFKLEDQKYLPPKFSYSVKQMAVDLNIDNCLAADISDTCSNISSASSINHSIVSGLRYQPILPKVQE